MTIRDNYYTNDDGLTIGFGTTQTCYWRTRLQALVFLDSTAKWQ